MDPLLSKTVKVQLESESCELTVVSSLGGVSQSEELIGLSSVKREVRGDYEISKALKEHFGEYLPLGLRPFLGRERFHLIGRESFHLFDAQALAHVVGDRIAKESTYVGWNETAAREVLITLLELFQGKYASPKINQAIEILNSSIPNASDTLQETAITYAKKILDLRCGEKTIIAAGFANHSVIFEFSRNQRDLFDINIYHGTVDDANCLEIVNALDIKIKPIRFFNIPKEFLLRGVNHAAFFETLLEIKAGLTPVTTIESIIALFFSNLERADQESVELERFTHIQHSGTCSWRSLMSWFYFQVDLDEYKRVITWISMQTLLICREKFFGEEKIRSELLRFLRECAVQLLHQSRARIEKYGECEQFITAASASCEVIEECDVRGGDLLVAVSQTNQSALAEIDTQSYASQFKRVMKTPLLRGDVYIPSPQYFGSELFKGVSHLSLDALVNICSKMDRVYSSAFQENLTGWVLGVGKLSDISTWGGALVSDESLPLLLKLQTSLARSNNCRHRLASYKLMAITHYVAIEISRKIDRGLLEKQKLHDVLGMFLKDRFLIIHDLTSISLIEELKLYFKPYVSEDERERLIPLSVGNEPDYIEENHSQAIVRFFLKMLDNLPEEKAKEIIGESGSKQAVIQLLKKGSVDITPLNPFYPAFLLIQSLYLGLIDQFVVENRVCEMPTFLCNGREASMCVYFQLEGVRNKSFFDTPLSGTLHLCDEGFLNETQNKALWDRSQLPVEGWAVLHALDSEVKESFEYGQVEPRLTPTYLLHYFGDHLEKLADPKIMSHFTIAFFKLLDLKGERELVFPIGEALLESSFRAQFAGFINRALVHFSKETFDGKPNHKVCMALMRIFLVSSSIYQEKRGKPLNKDGFVEVMNYLNIDISKEDSLVNKKMNYLLLVYWGCINDDDTHYAASSICKSWVAYQSIREEEFAEEGVIWFQQIAENIYYQKVEILVQRLGAPGIKEVVGIGGGEWEEIEGISTAFNWRSGEHFRQIDFLTGALTTESGVVSGGKLPFWMKLDSFKKRFPKAERFQIEGPYLNFSVGLTKFRALFDPSGAGYQFELSFKKWTSSLEMEFVGMWIPFVDPEDLLKIVPGSLAAHYLYFKDQSGRVIRGFSRGDFSCRILISKESVEDIRMNAQIKKLKDGGDFFGSLLKRSHVEIYEANDGNRIAKFPLMHVWGGSQFFLVFDQAKGKWTHPVYDGYYLTESEGVKSPFGLITQYITFNNEEGKTIYYLPFCEWGYKDETSPFSTGVVPQFKKTDLFSSLNGTRYIAEYRLNGSGKIAPTTKEGELYLAFIWLTQKRFDLFLSLLKKIDSAALRSSTCRELFFASIDFFEVNQEFSQPHVAALMHLISFGKDIVLKEKKEWVQKIYTAYLKNFSRLPLHFRLVPEKEEPFARFFEFDWRLEELSQPSKMYQKRLCIAKSIFTVLPFDSLKDVQMKAVPLNGSPYESQRKFPVRLGKLLGSDRQILTKKRAELIDYTSGITTLPQLDHVEFYIQTQIRLTYMNTSYACLRKERLAFLVFLKAVHHMRESDIQKVAPRFNPKIYSQFMRHLPYLKGEARRECDDAQIEGDFQELISAASSLMPNVRLLASKRGEEMLSQAPSSRLHLFDKFKPPHLWKSLPKSKEDSLEPLFREDDLLGGFEQREIHHDRISALPELPDEILSDLSRGEQLLLARNETRISDKSKEVIERVKLALEELKKTANIRESRILEQINIIQGLNPLVTLLKKEAGVQKKLEIADAIYLFLFGRIDLFQKENPDLTRDDIATLMREIRTYLFYKTEEQHLERILELYHDCKKDPSTMNHMKLYETLRSSREYDPTSSPYLLVFEYGIDIRIRKKQVDLLNEMMRSHKKDLTPLFVQLNMGEGKTSVFVPILLLIACMKGESPIYITPKSQIGMGKQILEQFLSKVFNKGLYFLDLESSQITKKNIERIERELKIALQMKTPIMSARETIQLLQLEFIVRVKQIGIKSLDEEVSYIKRLASINLLVKNCPLIADECDLVFKISDEVNIPTGRKMNLSDEEVEMMGRMYRLLLKHDSLIGLSLNRQSEMDIELFKREIAPKIAQEISDDFFDLGLRKDLLVEFLLNQMEVPLNPDQSDFMQKLNSLYQKKPSRVNQIALAKQILSDFLPLVFTKSYGRHYAREPVKGSFLINTLQGVDAYTSNKVLNPYECALYHMQAAVFAKLTVDHIAQFAEVMRERVLQAAKEGGISVADEIFETESFCEITGIPLKEADSESFLLQAVQKLEKERARSNFENILALEEIMLRSVIVYYSHSLSSRSYDLLRQFKSVVAFSGTPPFNMGRNISDLGGTGQVIATFLSRAQLQSDCVCVVKTTHPKEVLETLWAAPKKPTALFDPSGMFKDKKNKEIALAIKEFLLSESSHCYKGVLYFARCPVRLGETILSPELSASEGSISQESPGASDFLAYLPLNSDQVVYLNGTNLRAFKEKGLLLEDCFVYLDERHTTGTDLPLPSLSYAAIMVSYSLSYSRFCQAIMRLRAYLTTQDITVVTTKKLTASEVVQMTADAERKEKIEMIYRQFCQKVDAVARSIALQELLRLASNPEKVMSELVKMKERLEPLFLTDMTNDPYTLFGGPSEWIETKKMLVDRYRQRENIVLSGVSTEAVRSAFSQEFLAIENEIDQAMASLVLPHTQQKPMAAIGQTFEQAVVQEAEMEQNQEIDMDLEQINGFKGGEPFIETEWNERLASGIILEMERGEIRRPLMAQFSERFVDSFIDRIPNLSQFAGVIDPEILVTENFAKVTNSYNPLFHKHSKRIIYVLGIHANDGRYRFVLLTLHEALFWKNYLKRRLDSRVLLFDKTGGSIIDREAPTDPHFIKLLIQLNALAGNVSYLVKYQKEALDWLSKNRVNKLKLIEYALACHQDIAQKALFKENPLFRESGQSNVRRTRHVTESLVKRVQSLESSGVGTLSAELVHLLKPSQVKHLKTVDQLLELPDALVVYVKSEQANLLSKKHIENLNRVEMIQAITERPDLLCELSSEQLDHLTEAQVKQVADNPDVVARFNERAARKLPRNKVCALKNRVAIQSVDDDEGIAHLIPDQFSTLKKGQVQKLIQLQIIQIQEKDFIKQLLPWQLMFVTDSQIEKFEIHEIPDERVLQIETSGAFGVIGSARIQQIVKDADNGTITQFATRYILDQVAKLVVEELSDEELESLADKVLTYLTSDRIRELTNIGSIFEMLNESQKLEITDDQIDAISYKMDDFLETKTDEELFKLRDAFLLHLSKARLGLITTPKLLDRLTDSQLYNLKEEQVVQISGKRIKEIENIMLLPKLANVQLNNLLDGQIRKFGWKISQILKEKSEEELLELREALLMDLPIARISRIMSIDLLSHLPQLCLNHLTDRQILLRGIDGLSDERILAIKDKELIELVGRYYFEQIKKRVSQAGSYSPSMEVKKFIGGEESQPITANDLTDEEYYLGNRKLLKTMTAQRIAKIDHKKLIHKLVKFLGFAAYDSITDNQILKFDLLDLPLKRILVIEDEKTLSLVISVGELRHHLYEMQDRDLLGVSKTVLGKLSIARIRMIKDGRLCSELSWDMRDKLTEDQLHIAPGLLVPYLSQERTRELTDLNLIQRAYGSFLTLEQALALSDYFLFEIKKDVLEGFLKSASDQRIHDISGEFISKIESKEILERLSPWQLLFLTEAQIEMGGEIVKTRLRVIQAVQAIQNPGELDALRDGALLLLSDEQLLLANNALLSRLPDQRILKIHTREVLNKICPNRISHVVNSLIDQQLLLIDTLLKEYLSKERISAIWYGELIRELSPDQAMHLRDASIFWLNTSSIERMEERHLRFFMPKFSSDQESAVSYVFPKFYKGYSLTE
jgi:hypothetical protein